jgi:hypothetical protein
MMVQLNGNYYTKQEEKKKKEKKNRDSPVYSRGDYIKECIRR